MSETTTYDPMALVKEWSTAVGDVPFIEQPDAFGRMKLALLRVKLLKEESDEAIDELLDLKNGSGSYLRLAKELADVLYVVYGTAALFDIPIEKVFAEVHRSNMSKLDEDGKPVLRADGKVLKGPNYVEADIAGVLGVST